MTRRYADHYLADICVLAQTILDDFAELQKRLALWSRDGYPTGSLNARSSGTVSDPTANAALSSDEVRRDRDELSSLIVRAHGLLRDADNIRARYMNTTINAEQHNAQLTRCENIHGCPDGAWACKAGRCTTCYQFNRRNGRDRAA